MSKRPEQKQNRRRLKPFSAIRFLLLIAVYLAFTTAAGLYYVYAEFAYDLPQDLTALRDPPNKATRVYSADGELIGEFFLQKRVVVSLDRLPEHVQQAFVAAEDGRFWQHPGFDPIGIIRAAYSNFRGGGSKQGASTITQQLTRDVMGLSKERSVERKIRELILSIRVEAELAKADILEMYLNRVYLGRGAHGVQAAAEAYFAKDVGQLTVGEAALLAGLVQRPSDYSPHRNLVAARGRQSYVLGRMVEDGYISELESERAAAELLALVPDGGELNKLSAPHFVENVRRWAIARFGHNSVFYGGLRIYTTLDIEAQRTAEAAVKAGLEAFDRKIGFRGPVGKLEDDELARFLASPPRPYVEGLGAGDVASLAEGAELIRDVPYLAAVVGLRSGATQVAVGTERFTLSRTDSYWLRRWRTEIEGRTRWQSLELGHTVPVELVEDDDALTLRPYQRPDIQGSLVAMDPHTGRIEAMVGGYDYRESEFNRVTQAKRQIGSAFKPFIYATAMGRRAVNHLSLVVDAPIAVRTAGGLWSPKNYDGKYRGTMTLRTALAKSINTISVRLMLKTGVDAVIATARRLGIVSPIPRHISIALGTPDLTLLEVVGAYAAFANGGKRIPPQDIFADRLPGKFVELVTTDDGTVLADFREQIPKEQAISKELAYMTADLMKAVVHRGTARAAQLIGRPAAGKTGTSTGWRDAWFLGYTADRICGVWVGRDDFTPVGARATGGGAALPIWIDYMMGAHPKTPPRDFAIPEDVILVRADEISGQPLAPGSRTAAWVPFLRGSVPHNLAADVERTRFHETDRFTDREPVKRDPP
jgi:penicillin-binding protein 1A